MGLFSKIKDMFNNSSVSNEEELDSEVLRQEEEEKNEDFTSEIVENSEIESKKIEKRDFKETVKKEVPSSVNLDVKVYEKGLTKTRKSFVSNLIGLTSRYQKITDEYFDELEEILIMADIGVNTVMSFMDRLRDRVKKEKLENPEDLKEIIVDELFIIYVDDSILTNKIHYAESGPTILLFVGVNGVGKTTTIGKLAWKLKNEGKKVLLVGGDTFRAGATKQLEEWSKKVDVGFVGKEEGSDPASVVFDGLKKAKDESYDVVLIDTAGRLQNRVNLMN